MDARTQVETQVVGALPLVGALLEQWGLAEIVDQVVPWDGEVALGTLVEVLVLNRLLNPQAMYAIGDWAAGAAVTDYLGLTAEQLNDDRLGRALERLAEHGLEVQSAATLAAVQRWQLKVKPIHYDISTAELYGAYPHAQPAADADAGTGPSPTKLPRVPFPTYGRTKSGRADVKQVQFGLDVLGDGAVPVALLPLAGNSAEARTHVANLLHLRKMFPRHRFLYLGDTKLDTPENLAAAQQTAGEFLCAGAFTQPLQARFREVKKQLQPVAYCSPADAKKPPEERDHYQACEVPDKVVGIFAGRRVGVKHRLIFVHSSAKAKQQAETRERHLTKIRAEFEQVEKILGKYSLKTEAAIRRRLEQARSRYSEGKLFAYTLTAKRGQFSLTWQIDEAALALQKELDGVFVLRTNLSKSKHPIATVLATYREQSKVEKRFHHLKGPLAITPMFLENPQRIAGLLIILMWALTVLALMERQVRKNLKGKPMYGLYPEKRPSPAPTGPRLLEKFETLCIVIIHDHSGTHRRLAQLSNIQREILKLLSLPDTALKTFKRRCGT
ncbi:MAG: IS1634 family transposase [Planctomycetes bacterium]|nr:IS1634 family transposase [Planctomycetota bacterium]